MNNDKFLKRLSEVAEWHRPHLGPNGCYSVAKGKTVKTVEHPGAITELELEAMTDWEVQQYYDQLMAWQESQPNESVPPEIVKVKVQAVDCEDCGRYCEHGRRTQRKLHENIQRHWREFCTECEQFKNPETGRFDIPKLGSHQFFRNYLKPKLGRWPNQSPDLPKISRQQLIRKIEENEHQIIRYFQEKK